MTDKSEQREKIMSSFSKACAELSNSIKGFRLTRSRENSTSSSSVGGGSATSPNGTSKDAMNNTVMVTINGKVPSPNGKVPQQTQAISPTSISTKPRKYDLNGYIPKHGQLTQDDMWTDQYFTSKLFWYFSTCERCTLAQVSEKWRDVLYRPEYWLGVTPVLNFKDIKDDSTRKKFYASFLQRGFDSIGLYGATDNDLISFITDFPYSRKHIRSLALRCSNITDQGLESMLEKMQCVYRLELSGCNELTEPGLWSCLNSKIVSLSISDCINVADDTIAAISQLLPSLYELNIQAYHVTDGAMAYFSAKQSYTLNILRLTSCWEITNHGIVNLVHSLPNLTTISLSGCSKITDDGIEVIAENLRKLRSLDLSWCSRITDASLEYIACDLGQLEELTLDRCNNITDVGVGYLSTMTSLIRLYLRWCTQIRDFGLQHILTMKNLRILSLAGCTQLTNTGVSSLVQMRYLEELELTNCGPGASKEVCQYLRDNMYKCLILE
ncbi:unnamed protein product [Owenia fusiformis]|uniref:F-box/LRR-repeat protein 15-like leucin rich repeat domain-containing protein n=1 Tax=Owenia fusiformis TaxID=6347 RepID=A0A8J1Y5J7_OWEFU|nr:unnamed protein product [Owenia fusiformis]